MSERESARSGRTGGRAGHQHRPGQEAARMEIRPDRFKAAAGKTLGKIHRYTRISNGSDSTCDSPPIFVAFVENTFVVRDTTAHHAVAVSPSSFLQRIKKKLWSSLIVRGKCGGDTHIMKV